MYRLSQCFLLFFFFFFIYALITDQDMGFLIVKYYYHLVEYGMKTFLSVVNFIYSLS